MKYFLIIIFSILLFSVDIDAQSVTFNETYDVSSMMDRYTSNNKATSTIKGWRIQIISTNDRRAMESALSKFSGMFPDMETSWKHMAPYYQVRVGAYENKTNLMAFLTQIKADFPLATPIVDEIEKTEFVR